MSSYILRSLTQDSLSDTALILKDLAKMIVTCHFESRHKKRHAPQIVCTLTNSTRCVILFSMRKSKFCIACNRVWATKGRLCVTCSNIRYKYGVDPTEVAIIRRDLGGLCSICHKEPKGNKPLGIDRELNTGRIRGLICIGCRMGIGYLSTPEVLIKASEYLKRGPLNITYVDKNPFKVDDSFMVELMFKPEYSSSRAKANVLAEKANITFDCALSRIRRWKPDNPVKSDEINEVQKGA